MLFPSLKNKIVRFLLLALAIYVAWFLLYELVLKPYTTLDARFIAFIISNAAFVLDSAGYQTYRAIEEDNMQLLGVDGAHPVWIGAACNAITLFAFFTLFIIAFPGPLKKKAWFIPCGLLIIHLSNVLRVIALVLINYYRPQYLDFNHTYTFTVIVYAIIFMLWMWWVRIALPQKAGKNA